MDKLYQSSSIPAGGGRLGRKNLGRQPSLVTQDQLPLRRPRAESRTVQRRGSASRGHHGHGRKTSQRRYASAWSALLGAAAAI